MITHCNKGPFAARGERKKAAAAPVAKMFNFAHEVLLARLLLRRWQRKIKAVSAKRQKAARRRGMHFNYAVSNTLQQLC
jgi:hypothetical protein